MTTSRKQRFKDLMRYRNTEDQGLTFSQIFCEVYSDVVEQQLKKKTDLGRSEYDAYFHDYITSLMYFSSDDMYYKVKYLRKMIKRVRL